MPARDLPATRGGSNESCIDCPSDDLATRRAQVCKACPAGKYTNCRGRRSAPSAPPELLRVEADSSMVFQGCRPGTWSDTMAANSSGTCWLLRRHLLARHGRDQLGRSGVHTRHVPEPGMDLCTPCPAGTYQPDRGAETCKNCTLYSWCGGDSAPTPCGAGTVGSREGLSSAEQCGPCPPGVLQRRRSHRLRCLDLQ